jgi:thiamine transporter
MVPIIIIGLRHGPVWGLSTAFVYSMVQFMFDAAKLSGWGVIGAKNMIMCSLLDYIVAFTILGAAGFFKSAVDKTPARGKKIVFATVASLAVCVLRYISHVFVGAVVWYEITKAGNWNEYVHTVGAWLYSIVYNLQYMLPETIITLIAAPAVVTILSVVNVQRKNTLQ